MSTAVMIEIFPMIPVVNERYDEEWNDFSSQEDFEFENNKLPLESIPEPEYDEEEVLLKMGLQDIEYVTDDSDLNLVIDENFTAASPLHRRGFSYLQAGARATFGFFSGKVCFEVKVLQCGKVSSRQGHLNTHLLRVGWSPRKSSLALGSDHKSYGYDNAGRVSTIGEIVDYGKMFSTGHVVGAYMDAAEDVVTLSFTLNGEDMGVAYQIPQSEIQKEPLFPHILTKNISYECNFGSEKPWFPLKEGYTFVAHVNKVYRIAGPRRPKSQSECELMDPERKAIILSRTKLLGKLLGIAMDRRRNYILDQANVGWEEQVWKLGYFRNHKRRIVAIVIPDEELKKRCKKFDDNDLDWMYSLKAKYRLPIMSCRQISDVANAVEYVGLPLNKALPLVKFYNREAWRLGYKNKKFWIPSQTFKERKNITEGDWMPKGMTDPRDADFHGRGGRSSPPRDRGGDEWFPPSRDRSGGEWQSPPRTKESGEWRSPSRQRTGGDWPPSRRRSPGAWPPPECNRSGDMSGSPSHGQPAEGWLPGRKRRYSESPPRRRPGTRWGPELDERNLPQGRAEEWQPRRVRSPGPPNSPLRRRPDTPTRYPGRHSPPRIRTEEPEFGRSSVHADEIGDWQPNQGGRPMQENLDRERWIEMGTERSGKFSSRGARNRSSAYPRDMQLGDFPPERRGDAGMLPHESRASGNLPSQDADYGGRFSHRGGIACGRSLSPPPLRMDSEFPHEETRFSSKMLNTKERIGNLMLSREVRMDTDFSSQDQRMGGTFPPTDSEFPLQDSQFERERIVFEERGNMPMTDSRMGHGLSPRSRKGNDFPTPERRTAGLSVRDRLGAKLDDVPPRGVRPARSLSPRERMMGDVLPNNRRMPSDTTSFESEMGDFPPHEGRFDETPPHMGKLRNERMGPIGRSGGNVFPHESRRDDSRTIRLIGNLPPQEHRIGELPPHEDRMGGDFAHHDGRPGDRLLPHGCRRAGDFGPDVTGYQFPHHDQPDVNLSLHESRMGSDVLPHEIRNADFPFHEGRIGHGDLHRGREIDLPRGGRMTGAIPIRVEVGGEITSHRGRMVGEVPSGGNRSGGSDLLHGNKGGEFPPNSGRMDVDLPLRGRGSSGEFVPHGSKSIGNLPPRDRIGRDRLPYRERITGDVEPHGGQHDDLPPVEGRHGGDMPDPGGKSFSDVPLFEGRHNEFPSRGGRPGNDKPHHARSGGDLTPERRMYRGDFATHGRRIGNDDVPHSGRRIGGDKAQETGMLDDPHEGRSSSSDHWNRLPADREDPRNFEWMGAQELDPNKRMSPNRSPHKWSSPSRPRRPASPSLNRTRRQSLSPVRRSRIDDQGLSQNIEQPGGRHVSPTRPVVGRQSPVGRSERRSPERRQASHQQPLVRGGGGGGDSWRTPSDRHGGDWQLLERGNRSGPSHRLPSNVDRSRHSPPRKQQRLETSLGDRPSRPCTEGLDSRDPQGPGFQLIGNIDKKLEPTERNLHDRLCAGSCWMAKCARSTTQGLAVLRRWGWREPVGKASAYVRVELECLSGKPPLPPFVNEKLLREGLGRLVASSVVHARQEVVVKVTVFFTSPCMFFSLVDSVKQHIVLFEHFPAKQQGKDRVPEEEEELAPYEIPFNQADWDSNDPNAGIFYSANREQQLSSVDPVDERNKESSGRNQEARGHSESKGRGSVWQRVGGYVDDEKESGRRGPRDPGRYTDHSSRGERGHRGLERGNKDREREFEVSRVRRGRDK
ncbi:ATP-dependent RNA helicase Ddx1 [Gryllus bimaculatus]|nr:ATP-dependent RNA helicase Ddx1 [Gryllus bimaculatus]